VLPKVLSRGLQPHNPSITVGLGALLTAQKTFQVLGRKKEGSKEGRKEREKEERKEGREEGRKEGGRKKEKKERRKNERERKRKKERERERKVNSCVLGLETWIA
jgi:hypothetical protein